ncbi:MAG: hypothetical protein MJB57_13275 [Gemmatimonadetes bacterium]|nr:hypothetical protein [Gemmatimonadota bacterium]
MAAAGHRHRLRRGRPPAPLRALRAIAAASVAGLVGLVGYETLRHFGFHARWDRGPAPASAPASTAAELAAPGRSPESSRRPASAISTPSDPEEAEAAPEPAPDPGAGGLRAPGSPGVPATAPIGHGEYAAIDFETYVDGRPICSNCAVADEWASLGLRVSFHSWTADATRPFVLDGRAFLPEGVPKHALGPALQGERGLEVGVLVLDFPGRPRRVALTLYGPDLIETFDLAAGSGDVRRADATITRTVLRRYRPVGRGLFRAERILVETERGIDRVSLDGWGPPGHVLLVDELAIDP